MAKYLVTGGAGFIGSHISEALVKRGQEVTVFDNLSTGRRENMASFESGVNFVEGDVRDEAAVARAVAGADYVIHQAALASVPRSIDNPTASQQVNTQGTLNVLIAARDAGAKRVVYASSSSVYGDSEVLPKVETMAPSPKSPYAAAKLGGEQYCVIFSEVYGLPTTSLRYFNVFGPRQDPKSQYAAVIPIFTTALIANESPTIFGDGEQSRDFTYIDNVVAANLMACEEEDPAGKVYNIACGDRFTLNELYTRLKEITGATVDPEYAQPRSGDVKHSQADIGRIQKALNFEVLVGFEDGLARTVDWYKSVGAAK
jgi:nucleoside-diphosphate-sugar epimerase